jgi:hypothetical protein
MDQEKKQWREGPQLSPRVIEQIKKKKAQKEKETQAQKLKPSPIAIGLLLVCGTFWYFSAHSSLSSLIANWK